MKTKTYLIECLRHNGGKSNPKLWWGPNSIGYTWDIRKAGRYSYEDAFPICDPDRRNEEIMWDEVEVLTGAAGKLKTLNWGQERLVVVGGRLKDEF